MGQQHNDEKKPNPGQGTKRDDMQRSPGVDQGGQRSGQKMDRPDSDNDAGGTGRKGGAQSDDQE